MSPETALPLQPPSAYEANRDIVFMTLPLLALSTYFTARALRCCA